MLTTILSVMFCAGPAPKAAAFMPPVRWYEGPAEPLLDDVLKRFLRAKPAEADRGRAAVKAAAAKIDAYRAKIKGEIAGLIAERDELKKAGYTGNRDKWDAWFDRNRELYKPIRAIVAETEASFELDAGPPMPSAVPQVPPSGRQPPATRVERADPPVVWYRVPAESLTADKLKAFLLAKPEEAERGQAVVKAAAAKIETYRVKIKDDIAKHDAQRTELRKSGYTAVRGQWDVWLEANRRLYAPVAEILAEAEAALGLKPAAPAGAAPVPGRPAGAEPVPAEDRKSAVEPRELREKLRALEESLANLGPAGQEARWRFREFRELERRLGKQLEIPPVPLRDPLRVLLDAAPGFVVIQLGLPEDSVSVFAVITGSRAEAMGLKADDLIIRLNGGAVGGARQVHDAAAMGLLKLEIIRAGKIMTLEEKE